MQVQKIKASHPPQTEWLIYTDSSCCGHFCHNQPEGLGRNWEVHCNSGLQLGHCNLTESIHLRGKGERGHLICPYSYYLAYIVQTIISIYILRTTELNGVIRVHAASPKISELQ